MNIYGNEILLICMTQISAWFLTLAADRLVKPYPGTPLRNPKAALVHFFLSSCFFYSVLLVSGRIVFTAAGLLGIYLLLVFVSNAKYRSLREPVVFSDYDYISDAFRFPRLYFPYLGAKGTAGAVCSLVLAGCAFYFEPLKKVFSMSDPAVYWCIANMLASLTVLFISAGKFRPVIFKPVQDLQQFGLLLCLWFYFTGYLKKPEAESPFSSLMNRENDSSPDQANTGSAKRPHLIAVQSESFFDPRNWNRNIRYGILKNYDLISAESEMHGSLHVPAWGANTVRTEFSFLTGVAPEKMKAHQFSPYQICARNFEIGSIVAFLKSSGYRTVCIHPYDSGFYNRNVIFRKWGFDEFIDIEHFSDDHKAGPYISDLALADCALEVLSQQKAGNKPLFMFIITMENHGPLSLENIEKQEYRSYFNDIAPVLKDRMEFYRKYRDLAVYLRHLAGCDLMLKKITEALDGEGETASLVFYGDHIPIMPELYESDGNPDGTVPYFIWNSRRLKESIACGYRADACSEKTGEIKENSRIHGIEDLALNWLKLCSLINDHHDRK